MPAHMRVSGLRLGSCQAPQRWTDVQQSGRGMAWRRWGCWVLVINAFAELAFVQVGTYGYVRSILRRGRAATGSAIPNAHHPAGMGKPALAWDFPGCCGGLRPSMYLVETSTGSG
ncbi:uncharacterized protein TRIVIDRAFT_62012 [Trichoderma virens Gv29-8]|uniref:Uncharacterized protein n=1 Tax=Hypocrea virens (strain Gv29-8 / FGSC 10586) TaxID=413071 RepID=G9MIK5_HYPVG|nr:uncharacterized protein TRIVIDRAFT_62012 [Trichoderma virens Gv29-8]EHK25322.1 hypothetical protein TRIVIDRAFT_62012 [Trichoderma virens Gv29-8]